MQYYDYYDLKNIKEIEQRIKTLTNLKTYAIIDHDRDTRDDGELKKKHFHIVLTFADTTTSTTIAKKMHLEEQYINKIKTSTKSAELYLIHKNDPDKFQYSPNDVVANFDYAEKYDGVKPYQNRQTIAFKIDEGLIKPYNLYDFISIDEYSKNKNYYLNCFQFRQQKLKGVDRDMDCIFITGASQTGKTTYAKQLATNFGYHAYVSSGGKNPLDDYMGEECIILDDLRPSDYKLSDFLKLTDNNTDSLVGCRFYNKSISECKLLIVTSIKTIYEFYNNVIQEEYEPQKQLFRRFKCYIILDKEFCFYNAYDETKGEYYLDNKTVNPVSLQYNPQINKKYTSKFMEAMGLDPISDETNTEQLIF